MSELNKFISLSEAVKYALITEAKLKELISQELIRTGQGDTIMSEDLYRCMTDGNRSLRMSLARMAAKDREREAATTRINEIDGLISELRLEAGMEPEEVVSRYSPEVTHHKRMMARH